MGWGKGEGAREVKSLSSRLSSVSPSRARSLYARVSYSHLEPISDKYSFSKEEHAKTSDISCEFWWGNIKLSKATCGFTKCCSVWPFWFTQVSFFLQSEKASYSGSHVSYFTVITVLCLTAIAIRVIHDFRAETEVTMVDFCNSVLEMPSTVSARAYMMLFMGHSCWCLLGFEKLTKYLFHESNIFKFFFLSRHTDYAHWLIFSFILFTHTHIYIYIYI